MLNFEEIFSYYTPLDTTVFLSGAAAVNETQLKENKITHVLNVAAEIIDTIPPGIQHLHLPIADSQEQSLKEYFDVAIKFIQTGQKEGAVLIHCQFGISRSASIACAWMLYEEHQKGSPVDFTVTIDKIRAQRAIVSPNANFMAQLQYYADQLNKYLPTERLIQRISF